MVPHRRTIFITYLPLKLGMSPPSKPGKNLFFLWDFSDGLDLAVHNHRRRAEDAVFGDLHDVADLLDVRRDARLGYRLPD